MNDRQDNQSEQLFGQTPWQTVGPFFHYSLAWPGGADLTGQTDLGGRTDLLLPDHRHLLSHGQESIVKGERITIQGRVLDGASAPVPDALVESWQADAEGNYQRSIALYGRCATQEDGSFVFHTIRPGCVSDQHGQIHAPHVTLLVLARGVIKGLLTRMYFSGAAENESDPVLGLVPAHRQHTLLAIRAGDAWQFDIRLQGENETVFFQC